MLCSPIHAYSDSGVFCLVLSVVVLGFEKEAYVVFEGQSIEVCVAILNRTLTNDEHRVFTVSTSQLTATSKNECHT